LSPRVDLHLHTTASDGRLSPRDLVDRAAAESLTVIAVTDHDTTAAVVEARDYARTRGLESIAGIEITAVADGADVHMLGYFFNPDEPNLADFLAVQRGNRMRRVEAIGRRLAELGMPIDVEPILADARAQRGRSVGRPQVARALIAAGHVADMREAFDRWLGRGCPAFIERTGASPQEVVEIVHRAGGLVSMAHPGRTAMDALIAPLAAGGLDALEVYHPDHGADAIARYRALADAHGLLITGGSDFHADPARPIVPGSATLPDADWERLRNRAGHDA
jgi:predicted metal-dependent phosphoesterase TrpH